MSRTVLEDIHGTYYAALVIDRTEDGLVLSTETDADLPQDCRVFLAEGAVEGAVVEVSRVGKKRFHARFRFAERQFLDALRRLSFKR